MCYICIFCEKNSKLSQSFFQNSYSHILENTIRIRLIRDARNFSLPEILRTFLWCVRFKKLYPPCIKFNLTIMVKRVAYLRATSKSWFSRIDRISGDARAGRRKTNPPREPPNLLPFFPFASTTLVVVSSGCLHSAPARQNIKIITFQRRDAASLSRYRAENGITLLWRRKRARVRTARDGASALFCITRSDSCAGVRGWERECYASAEVPGFTPIRDTFRRKRGG